MADNEQFRGITPVVANKIGRNLHNQIGHPIQIIKEMIYQHLGGRFKTFDDLSPIVSVAQNFDSLLIPADHLCRRPSDTFYFEGRQRLLRTHTSAHQVEIMRACDEFLVTGDVYRRDTVDRFHYPVFHQMEGVRLIPTPPGYRRNPNNENDLVTRIINEEKACVIIIGSANVR